MEITVGMVVNDAAKRDKYRRIVGSILRRELHDADIVFYSSLNDLYEKTVCDNQKPNILIIPAAPQSFKLAKEIRVRDRNCIIIYPAQNMNGILEAFESMPMAYILPQGTPEQGELEVSLKKAVKYIEKQTQDIIFETKSKLLHYAFYEIDYFESQYRIVHIIKRSGNTETITARLDDVQELLPRNFARCHQSFLVNMDNIKSIDKTEKTVQFYSGQSVPASKKLFTSFLDEYKNYLNGGEKNE